MSSQACRPPRPLATTADGFVTAVSPRQLAGASNDSNWNRAFLTRKEAYRRHAAMTSFTAESGSDAMSDLTVDKGDEKLRGIIVRAVQLWRRQFCWRIGQVVVEQTIQIDGYACRLTPSDESIGGALVVTVSMFRNGEEIAIANVAVCPRSETLH